MINDYLEPEDYVEPRCVLCGDAYGAMPEVKSVPQQRIVAKMDEYMAHRDYAGAERHLLYWLEEAELGHDLRGQLLLRNELAGHYRKVQDKKNATLNAEKALELLKALDFEDTISAGTTYVNAATVMNAFGEDERSLELFGKARSVYENAPRTDKALLGGLYNNMALACIALRRFEEADELYARALEIMANVENGQLEQAITYLNMADATVAKARMESGGDESAAMMDSACDEVVEEYLDIALDLLDTPSIPRDGYYAFVCEKCAPVFAHYGYFLAEKDLRNRAREIYG